MFSYSFTKCKFLIGFGLARDYCEIELVIPNISKTDLICQGDHDQISDRNDGSQAT